MAQVLKEEVTVKSKKPFFDIRWVLNKELSNETCLYYDPYAEEDSFLSENLLHVRDFESWNNKNNKKKHISVMLNATKNFNGKIYLSGLKIK